MPNWERIVIHHSATGDSNACDAESIKKFHATPDNKATEVVEGSGWRDIGYHGLVEIVDGKHRYIPGRPFWMVGSHCPGQNSIALGLCLVGDFSATPPSGLLLEFAADVCAEWCVQFGISPDELHPHKAFSKRRNALA